MASPPAGLFGRSTHGLAFGVAYSGAWKAAL